MRRACGGARYVVFLCADELEQTLDGSGRYYESIDLQDAWHPQTLLAYHERSAAAGRARRRCVSGSSASSVTSTPSI